MPNTYRLHKFSQGLSLNLALKYSEEAARTHRWAGTEVFPDMVEAESEKELVKTTSVNSPSRRNSAKDAISKCSDTLSQTFDIR